MSISLIVSSASAGGYGTLRALDGDSWTTFGPSEIRDPRGVRRRADDQYILVNEPRRGVWQLDFQGKPQGHIELPPGTDPGGGAFAPDGTYCVGSRAHKTIERVDLKEQRYVGRALTLEGITFPRGFAVLQNGDFVVTSGTDPVSGGGLRAVFYYRADGTLETEPLVHDPALDPLDLAMRDDQLYIASEFPFGAVDAVVSMRRYDARTGSLSGLWSGENAPAFVGVKRPRGITFDEHGTLLMCAQNCVLAIDTATPGSARVVARDEQLAGQSLAVRDSQTVSRTKYATV